MFEISTTTYVLHYNLLMKMIYSADFFVTQKKKKTIME